MKTEVEPRDLIVGKVYYDIPEGKIPMIYVGQSRFAYIFSVKSFIYIKYTEKECKRLCKKLNIPLDLNLIGFPKNAPSYNNTFYKNE